MENNINQKKKKLFVLIGVLVVIIIIVIIAATQGNKKAGVTPNSPTVNGTTGTPTTPVNPGAAVSPAAGNPASGTTTSIALPAGTRVEAPGAALISKDNQVVNAQGVALKNDIVPGAVAAPAETGPIAPSQVASNAVKLSISAAGWKPNQFTVKAGQPVTISITGTDQWAHIFAFKDPSLSAIAVGIGGTETRAITFQAPTKTGSYDFYCNVPGHEARGETGKMIVQ